jgi:hypothetical protein
MKNSKTKLKTAHTNNQINFRIAQSWYQIQVSLKGILKKIIKSPHFRIQPEKIVNTQVPEN